MRRMRQKSSWVAAVALLAVYCSCYAILRTQQTFVRTGVLHNVRIAGTGNMAPQGGWMQSGVRGNASVPGSQVLEVIYWPLTKIESLFWDTFGRRFRT